LANSPTLISPHTLNSFASTLECSVVRWFMNFIQLQTRVASMFTALVMEYRTLTPLASYTRT